MIKLNLSTRKINSLIGVVNFILFIALNVILMYFNTINLYIFASPIYIYLLHNLMNFVHQSSHNLLSRNKKINNFMGHLYCLFSLLSFVEFKKTHLLHHAHTLNPDKDPDWDISNNSPLLLMPFFIWKKDMYFLKNRLWKKNKKILYTYLTERITQISMIFLLIINGFLIHFLFFSTCLLVVGYLNAFFLFYFPHYELKSEKRIKSTPIINHFFNFPVETSRTYHDLHHKKIKDIKPYYPLENRIVSVLIRLF